MRPKITPWRLTIFLACAGCINYADRSALSAVLAPLKREFGFSDGMLGVLGSLFLWSYAFASPFAGLFADRFSRSRLAIWSLVLWSLATALTGAAGGFASLVTLRLGLGLAESLFHPAAFALVADYHGPETRGRAMSVLSVGFQSGIVLGGAAAGFMAQSWGWRWGFWILGAVGGAIALCSGWFVADPVRPATARPAAPRAGAALSYIARVPTYYILLAKCFIIDGTTWTFIGWLPLYLTETFHLKLGAAGFAGTFMLQTAFVGGIVLGGWFSDWVARRGAERRLAAMALFCLAAAPFPLVFLAHPSLTLVVVGMSFPALFRGLGQSNLHPITCDIIPSCYRSTAFGVTNAAATVSGALGVFAAGMLKRDFGLQAIFTATSVLYLIGGTALWLGRRRFFAADRARARDFEARA